jgi:hypothetical protein
MRCHYLTKNNGQPSAGGKNVDTMEKPIQVVSLCPSCSECPAVEVFRDLVRIGEGENTATLAKAEWNQLVEAIRTGKLSAIR